MAVPLHPSDGEKTPAIDPAQIAPLLQQRCEVLTDIPEKVDFFDALPEYDIALYTNKKSKTDPAVSLEMLKTVRPLLSELPVWTMRRCSRP